MYPLSNFMPSTTSSSSSIVFPSWTVMTPSLPTRSMASLISPPISASLLAEMVPTWLTSSREVMGRLISSKVSTTTATACWMPRRTSRGFMPAATALHPSRYMARAKTVAVVVPSPAMSFVLDATDLTSCAPMFSKLSSKSMALATVTPSFVIFGAPYGWAMIAFRPLGPRVTCTASASRSTPRSMAARPSTPNRISFPAAIPRDWPRSFDATAFLAAVFRTAARLRVLMVYLLFVVEDERMDGRRAVLREENE
mmetsp:Transcript_3205/g.6650  ORF Transcript_3205/g.6650 Transcript_3205/m.6650 type:complete len:254 (-) Transcript_3205:69-830(-)